MANVAAAEAELQNARTAYQAMPIPSNAYRITRAEVYLQNEKAAEANEQEALRLRHTGGPVAGENPAETALRLDRENAALDKKVNG